MRQPTIRPVRAAATALVLLAALAAAARGQNPAEAKVTAEVRAVLAADPLLRHVRYDGATVKSVGGATRLLVQGVCLGDDDTRKTAVRRQLRDLLKKELPARLQKAGVTVPAGAEVVLDEVDLAKPDAPAFRFVPRPHLAWQREAVKDATLDGVLFLDVYYLPDGKLQVLVVTNTREQEPRAAALVKADGEVVVTPVTTGGAWKERLQKKLAEAAGPSGVQFRRTRLDRVLWELSAEGEPEARLAGVSLAATGGQEVPLRKQLQAQLQTDLHAALAETRTTLLAGLRGDDPAIRLRREVVNLLPTRPVADATGLRFVADPVLALRDRAVTEPGLLGVLLAGHTFDEKGVLQLVGFARSEAQRKDVLARIAGPLADVPVGAASFRVVTDADLTAPVQKQFSADDESRTLRRTRLDRAYVRYVRPAAGEPEPRLVFEGVSLAPAAEATAIRDRVHAETARLLAALKVPFVPKPDDVLTAEVRHLPSPLAALQARSLADRSLDGVLFADLHYTATGELQVAVLAADAARQQAAIRTLVERAELPEAVVTPVGAGRTPRVVVREHAWAAKAEKWADLLAALQAALAGSTAPADAVFPRTRLDRATFSLDATEKPVLTFAGVLLYDPNEVPASDRPLVERYRAATEAERGKLLASEEYRKAPHARLRTKLLAEARKRLPGPDYEGNIDPLVLVATPAPQAQRTLPEELRRQGGVVLGFRYGPGGELLAQTRFLPAAARPKVEAALAELLRTSPVLRAGTAVRVEGGDERANWAGWLQAWQKRRAAASDTLARQTRIDGAAFDYDGAVRLVLSMEGITLTAAKDRPKLAERLTEITADELKGLGRDYSVDVAKMRQEPTALRDLQAAAAANPRLDGVLFSGAAYDGSGVLHLEGFRGEDAHRGLVKDLVAEFVRKTPLLRPSDSVDEAIKPLAPLEWSKYVREARTRFARGDDPLTRRTRLDRALFVLGSDPAKAGIRWEGVSLRAGNQAPEAAQKEIAGRLTDTAPRLAGVAAEIDAGGVAAEEDPSRVLQAAAVPDPANDGVLFEDARYDAEGRLHLQVLLADKQQQAKVEQMLRDKVVPERVLVRAGDERRPALETRLFDLRGLLRDLRVRLLKADDAQARRLRLDRGYFTYPTDRTAGVTLNVGGVLLKPLAQPDEAKLLGERVLEAVGTNLPKTSAGAVTVRPEMVVVENPARFLQMFVATVPALDGVGLTAAQFDDDGKLAVRGVWRSDKQEPELARTAKLVLPRERGALDRHGVVFRCTPLDTDRLLADLRSWAADTLEEAWIERLYFDAKNVVTVQGIVANKDDLTAIKARVLQLLRAHPQFRGRAQLDGAIAGRERPPQTTRLVSLQAFPSVGDEPGMDFGSRPAIAPRLRTLVQLPADGGARPSRRWDGVLIRRGCYTPEGKFGLHGLCDSAAQRQELTAFLAGIDDQAPYRDALRQGIDLAGLRVVPLAPMLERIRAVLPAYPRFDRLTVESAAQDVENRLVLRVNVAGRSPAAEAAEVVRKQLLEQETWRRRAEAGLRWDVVGRQPIDVALATDQRQRAAADLREAMPGPVLTVASDSTSYEQAIQRLTTALRHDPDDSTSWYLRAMYYLLNGDEAQARRDLRRMHLLEQDTQIGRVRRGERLKTCEPLQGDVRRRLEQLYRQVVLDVKRNAPPPTIAAQP